MDSFDRAALQIRGSGHSFAILQFGKIIARATTHGNAVAALPGIERRLQSKPRPCLRCHASFQSRGKHHRLCATCGQGSA